MIYSNSRFPAAPLRQQPTTNTKTSTRKPLDLQPPVAVQIFELLRENGFSFSEALQLAGKATASYTSTSQRVFQFGVVTIEISACVARLMYAPRGHETAARTSERIQTLLNSELEQRAKEIRKRREEDERRGNRW
jgi:hypothetical protein